MGAENLEQTLVLIKPDALKNSLTGYIISQLSEVHSGLRFSAAKVVNVNRMLAEEHYAEHRSKPFFEALLNYAMGRIHYPAETTGWKRRMIAIAYQGPNAVTCIRDFVGPTNPHQAREKQAGCIRSLGTVVPYINKEGKEDGIHIDNLVHASANKVDAKKELRLWFKPTDFPPLMRPFPTEVCKSLFYYKDGRLLEEYEDGSRCLLAPGDVAWRSDLRALRAIRRGAKASLSLESVAAKYTINLHPDPEVTG